MKMLSIVFTAIILLSGCSGNDFESPPKINPGQDPCDICFMIINEKKFAGSLWLNNGDAMRFDDIGEMIGFWKKNKNEIAASWVYDFNNEEAIGLYEAFYIRSDEIVTPMGSGVIAFKSEEAAEEFAEKYDAGVKSLDELKNNINNMEQ